MDRRVFLTASAAILAGCGQSPSTDSSPSTPSTETATVVDPEAETTTATETDSTTSTATETATETETETETPTTTETPELTEREQRAARALDRAIQELNQAVADFVGTDGDSLLDVSAASRPVRRSEVFSELAAADDHLTEARRLVSNRQQARLAAVEDARQFISLCLDAQTSLILTYAEAVASRDAVEAEQRDALISAIEDLRDNQRRARRPISSIESETSGETVSVVPAIPADDYEGKVAQFRAELDGFAVLASILDQLPPAIVDLNGAEQLDDQDREAIARERAQEAAVVFESVTTELRDLASELSENGASVADLSGDIADITASKAEKARRIEEANS